jgi:hypothetical protein
VGFFDRFRRDPATPSAAGTSRPSAQALAELKAFIAEREGVEGFIEPRTAIYAMTLCLVAADGEWLRRPVRDEAQARRLCADDDVPCYDARIVGYPRRMQEYEHGVRPERVSLDDLPPLDVIAEPEDD